MKKLTDEQIIKALEYCFTRGFDESTCYECPFYTATAKCTEDLRDSVLDLINRQAAEIEQWKEEADRWQNAFCKVNEDMSTIKSEAIKEFAEKLKERRGLNQMCIAIVSKNDIDNLVKEMTEER